MRPSSTATRNGPGPLGEPRQARIVVAAQAEAGLGPERSKVVAVAGLERAVLDAIEGSHEGECAPAGRTADNGGRAFPLTGGDRWARTKNSIDSREAARARRRDRDADAQKRDLMRPGMGKVFKQIQDAQAKAANEPAKKHRRHAS